MSLLDPLDPDRLPEEDDSPLRGWLGGILAPLPLAFFGLRCIVTQSATLMLGRGSTSHPVPLTGWEATACGGFLLFLAALLHSHFFWGSRGSSQTRRTVETVKTLLLSGLILCVLCITGAIVRRFFEFP
jgi:hypothetical protein